MIATEFVGLLDARGCSPKPNGPARWQALCPAHEDRVASLSVSQSNDGRVLLNCHASCPTPDVVAALGLKMADLFPSRNSGDRPSTPGPRKQPVALPSSFELKSWWEAAMANQSLLDRLREKRGWRPETLAKLGIGWHPKRKRLVIPIHGEEGDLVGVQLYLPGGEPKNLPLRSGMPRDLFPRPEGIDGDTIWLVEGEPDAITGHDLGLPAVAIPGVSFAKRDGWAHRLAGRDVVICFDCDDEGRKAAQEAAARVAAHATEVRIVDLGSNRSDKYDLTDLALEAGAEAAGFLAELAAQAPVVKPPALVVEGGLTTRRADVSRVRPLKWAWQDWVLLGYLNLLIGDEGAGKGVTLCHLIAKWSRGHLDGDLEGKPARVLLIGDEDGFDAVWTPRLIAAGADLDLIDNVEGDFDVRRDLPKLKKTIETSGVKIVIFDQLLDNLGVQVDDWKSKQVRHAIEPIRRLMGELEIAMLAALHTNKAGNGSFRQRVSGSQAFNALSRSSLWVTQHPEDEDRRVLIRGKGNYSAPPRPFEFEIDAKQIVVNGHKHTMPHATRFVPSDVTIDELLRPDRPLNSGSKVEAARTLLERMLADGLPHPSKECLVALEAAGIAKRTAYRAAEDIGVVQRREGFQQESTWALPGFETIEEAAA